MRLGYRRNFCLYLHPLKIQIVCIFISYEDTVRLGFRRNFCLYLHPLKIQIVCIFISYEDTDRKFLRNPNLNEINTKCMFNVYKNQQSRQTGSRNLMDPKTLPTIWGTYMKLVTKYQISAINSCWEKCDGKCAYMFNVYKNQLSRQTGSRKLTCPKTLPTIWYTYKMLVTKYQISAINSYGEKCDKKYLWWTEGRTEVKQYTLLPLRGAGV